MGPSSRSGRLAGASPTNVNTAMACWGMVSAQFIAGRAVRDALYLGRTDAAATLPLIVIAASVASIVLSFASARVLPRVPPSRFVPGLFVASAALFVVEWWLTFSGSGVASVLVYLHVTGLGPMLGSGFWLIASEGFDPHTAKRRFGQIMGVGTLGGLAGGVLAERSAVMSGSTDMLLVVALLNALCAGLTWKLAGADRDKDSTADIPTDLSPATPRSSLHILAEQSYLRSLAALVLLSTAGVSLVDYLFKVEAASALGNTDALLRFFGLFYGVTSLITFGVQAVASSTALDRLALSWLAGSSSLAVLIGGMGAFVWPGIASITAVRGAESVMRGSLFRASYEQLFTPVAAREKRAAKSIIDVAFDRAGDAVGGGVILLVGLIAAATTRSATLLVLSMAISVVTLIVARRLHHGYIGSLERSLAEQIQDQAVDFDASRVQDTLTHAAPTRTRVTSVRTTEHVTAAPQSSDPVVAAIASLRSRDARRVSEILKSPSGLADELVPHVIPLLAWDTVSKHAIAALRQVADRHVGTMVDALLDVDRVPGATRRRLARVFSVCSSQRALDGLLLGLDDTLWEVRFHCGYSMAKILERNADLSIDSDRVFGVVLRELSSGDEMWRSHRVLDAPDGEQSPFSDELVNIRASRSLAHVFTLLSLVLPRDPLQYAFLSLQTRDQLIRGTALEYLDRVLPRTIRDPLWPLLEKTEPREQVDDKPEEISERVMQAHKSIVINLEELRAKIKKEPSK